MKTIIYNAYKSFVNALDELYTRMCTLGLYGCCMILWQKHVYY